MIGGPPSWCCNSLAHARDRHKEDAPAVAASPTVPKAQGGVLHLIGHSSKVRRPVHTHACIA
jgi:hypothetical protein